MRRDLRPLLRHLRACPVHPGSSGRLAARKDTPALKPTSRWEAGKALDAIKSEDTRECALLELHKDMNAQSAGAPRDSLLKTWVHFHGAWFGHHSLDDEAQPFPLTRHENLCGGRHVEIWRLQVAGELPEPSQGGAYSPRVTSGQTSSHWR